MNSEFESAMSEVRIVRAGKHAVTLLADIHENAVRDLGDTLIHFANDDFGGLHDHASECSTHYFIGFEEHLPFGYIRISIDDGECEISGPYLYPNYLHRDLQTTLIEFTVDYMQNLKVRLAYALVVTAIPGAKEAFSSARFEDISDDPLFIKRWHDGILAHRAVPPDTQLFALILESSALPVDSE